MANVVFERSKSPTFDQLNVFLTVVEEGGFAAAARRLNRQQSAISYTIGMLESQIGGVLLFDRRNRSLTLTEIGKAILVDARRIANEIDSLQAHIQDLLRGIEAELAIVLDAMLPSLVLIKVLKEFREEFPNVALRIKTEVLGGVPESILDGSARIGVSGPLFYRVSGIDKERIGETSLLPVAAVDHPLSKRLGVISNREIKHHMQIVLTDRSKLSDGQEFAVASTETMRVSDLQTKFSLIRAGIGWGNLPEALILDELAAGRLTVLALAEWQRRPYPFHAVYRSGTPPGSAGRWFVDRLAQNLA